MADEQNQPGFGELIDPNADVIARLENIAAQVAANGEALTALRADVAKLGDAIAQSQHAATAPGLSYVNGMTDYRSDGTVRLQAFEELSPEDRAIVDRANLRSAAGSGIPALGPRFMIEAAINAFGLSDLKAQLVRRSCSIAGTDFNTPCWAWANLQGDEKLRYANAVPRGAEPAEWVAQTLARIKQAEADQDASDKLAKPA